MSVIRILPVLAFVVPLLGGCQDKEARRQIVEANERIQVMNKQVGDLRMWLGESPDPQKPPTMTVHQWHQAVYRAICSLEAKAKPPAADKLCDPVGDGEHNAPPKPPPFS